jgi:pimeloyl-ACP methyl ester carboxylesterase
MNRIIRWGAGLAVALAAIGAVATATSWEPDRDVASLKARWAPPPSQFVEVMGMAVHLRDEGPRDDAEPIVLLHGTSASLHTWDGWAEALKGQRRVIRVDLPGFGLTGPAPSGDYSVPAYVSFLVQLLDRLSVQRAVVGGNSFGGYLAWKLAADHPQRVSRLVLVDAAGYAFEPESIPLAFRMAQVKALKPLLDHTLPRGMVEASVKNVYGDPAKVTPELVDRYFELTLREGNRAALGERFRQSQGGEFEQQVPALQQPTLILWGGRDRLIPPAQGQRFAREIAGSRLVVFDDLGHVPHEEDPARTVAAVQAFLGAASAPAGAPSASPSSTSPATVSPSSVSPSSGTP